MSDKKPLLIAYAITQKNGKSFWNRIGVAFHNQDGSINVKLELIPIGGPCDLQLRPYEPRDKGGSGGGQGGGDDIPW